MRCPWPWLPVVSLFRIWRQFRYACSEGLLWALNEPWWWVNAFKGLPQCLKLSLRDSLVNLLQLDATGPPPTFCGNRLSNSQGTVAR